MPQALGARIVLSRTGEGNQPTEEPLTHYRKANLGLKAVLGRGLALGIRAINTQAQGAGAPFREIMNYRAFKVSVIVVL